MNHEEKPIYKVLAMVRVLHERGYQRLRIMPGLSPSGMYWRCTVTHRGNIKADHGAMAKDFNSETAHYSSGSDEQYFDWDDASGNTAEQLAGKFLERFEKIAALGYGEDEDYTLWYRNMLDGASRGELPVAYADWYEEPDPRWLPTNRSDSRLPMPPCCG